MGASHSREGLELSDESDYEDEEGSSRTESEEQYEDAADDHASMRTPQVSNRNLDELDSKLKALKLKYGSPVTPTNLRNAVKLYLHVGGNTPKAKWIISQKLTNYEFVKTLKIGGDDEDDYGSSSGGDEGFWVFEGGEED